jgi:hypothetical protein
MRRAAIRGGLIGAVAWTAVVAACVGDDPSSPPPGGLVDAGVAQPADVATTEAAAPGPDGCAPGGGRCGDVCVDLARDRENCGRCGRRCGTAGCAEGKCAVETVAPQEPQPWGLVVEGDEVLWTNWGNGGSVRRCNKNACTPTSVLASENDPRGLVVAGGKIFWAGHSALRMRTCPLAGPCTAATDFATTVPYPTDVVADGTHVYWSLATNVPAFQRCLHSGCGASAEQFPTGGDFTTSIALDATHVYWTTMGSTRGVWRGPKGGFATPSQLAPGVGSPHGVSVDATSVYWKDNGQVWSCGKAACTPAIKVADQPGDGTTAVHEGWLYWTVWKEPGYLRACQLPACAAVVELAPSPNVISLAFDATHVYWTTFAGDLATAVGPGRILRVAKP